MTRKRHDRSTSKYKSKLEERTKALLPDSVQYEPDRIPYTVVHHYKPDFKVGPTTYIESKGLFAPRDRAKHLYVREQHPEIKIYFLFQDANKRLNRSSDTTYAQWCDKHGFEWSDIKTGIPEHWLNTLNENPPRNRRGRRKKTDLSGGTS